MREVAMLLVAIAGAVLAATWLGYPLWLGLRAETNPRGPRRAPHPKWPSVTIVVVVRNAEASLRDLLYNVLAMAYPPDRRRVLVVSDGSDDFTDAVARSLTHRGVELLRMMQPGGRVAVENVVRRFVESDLVVFVNPAATFAPWALASLVEPFADPTVGVAFGREIVNTASGLTPPREPPYRRYEEWLRRHETAVFGTVSARGVLYAVRGSIFRIADPAWGSPDFALALAARECGCRAVYVRNALGVLGRGAAPGSEYMRKVRAVAQDVATLLLKPYLLNPLAYGEFALALMGHKLGRWLTPWALLAGVAGLVMLAPSEPWAAWTVAGLVAADLVAAVAVLLRGRTALARAAALPGRLTASAFAIMHACLRAPFELPAMRLQTAAR